MVLPTLQDRRERDLITLYKILNGFEKKDKHNLVMINEGNEQKGHSKKIRKNQCLKDIRKYSFSHLTVDIWKELNEDVVTATNIHRFKDMLDLLVPIPLLYPFLSFFISFLMFGDHTVTEYSNLRHIIQV